MRSNPVKVRERTEIVLSAPVNSATERPDGRASARRALAPYVWRLRAMDAVVIAIAVALGQALRFGHEDWVGPLGGSFITYTSVSVFLGLLWWAILGMQEARNDRILGRGMDDYRRVWVATVQLFGVVGMSSVVFGIDLARGYLAVALPVGLTGLMAVRWINRRKLAKARQAGEAVSRVLVVGSASSVESMVQSLERTRDAGFRVVGACVPDYEGPLGLSIGEGEGSVPIYGNQDFVLGAIDLCGADTVAVTATDQIGSVRMRNLGWELHERKVDLVVAPLVTEIAGPRVAVQPTGGLPLVYVEEPQYRGAVRFRKSTFDRVGASVLLFLLAPLLVAIAVAIKLDDRGPVFYRQTRVGQDGRVFRMWKFRSMVTNADALVEAVKKDAGIEDGAFFKLQNDPRITRMGRFLRKTSLDELPQLINVLTGEMSLVGPRPLQEGEGAEIEGFVERRLLVLPGITGLWQVSGRSDVSEDERVRLDLFYVENWSMFMDLLIILKTVRTVAAREGAY